MLVEPGSVAPHSSGCHTPAVYDDLSANLFDFHESMLADTLRTESFLRAILQEVKPGDVVVDIGAGTGVLSLFAILAGAGRVHAIEHGPMADVARQIAKANGIDDRLDIINDWSTQVTLAQPADVLITETIGNIGFEEGILSWVLDARRRLLKPGARIIPAALSMVAAAVQSSYDYKEISRLKQPLYELDFTALSDLGVHSMLWTDLSAVSLVSTPATVTRVDLADTDDEDVAGAVIVTARRDALVHGIGCWFTADIAPGISISNEPPTKAPNWNQGFLPLPDPVPVSQGEEMVITIQSQDGCARWGWSLGAGGPADLVWTASPAPQQPPPRSGGSTS